MIPTLEQARAMWEKYDLPQVKRNHVTLVAKTALFFAKKLQERKNININLPLLEAGALLHDIDKNIARLAGEQHPDTAVRVLKEEGMTEVAQLVRTHPLHAILDPTIAPITWEEKLLYLADKMVKHEIITVDKRFALWRTEKLPAAAVGMLDKTYPKVKALEKEVFEIIGIQASDVNLH